MTIVDSVSSIYYRTFKLFASVVLYTREGQNYSVLAVGRNFRGADELFGSALQSDKLVVIYGPDFQALGIGDPKKFDKIQLASGSHTIEEWKALPPIGTPVWYRLAARGGTQ